MAKSAKKLFGEICNNPRDVRFDVLCRVAEAFGFRHCRTSGSHRLYERDGISEPLNLQEVKGKAKPYQVRQFLKLVEKHSLEIR